MRFGLVDHAYLCFHSAEPPRDVEWTAFIDDITEKGDEFEEMLVFSFGGAPTVVQQRQVASLWQGRRRGPRIALVTPSAVARAASAALNWLLRQPIKTFTPTELGTCLTYLELTLSQREEMTSKLREWCRELGIPFTPPG
ncbi:hypothetical protein AKJ09_05461 [Labilithrix luteola]|uniref:Uncharacterized protein n=1 Tax=Labilithrix luteola TaxID=1391654 RepID=A0A0K1PZ83_9BACT|nr:hypothetical protein [Labilithrix luteola]AKU98797.1 hypothetical protein AKJ09_05461 [Labilithrix luteola]